MTVAARVVVTKSLLGPVAEKKLRARGIRCLCPMYSREVRHARKTLVKSYPLYSMYMFAWIEDDALRSVLAVPECVDVLRRAGDKKAMAIVPDDLIAAISSAPLFEDFEPGDELSVVHGRWEGFKGLCARTEEERVFLLFSVLGQRMEMPFHRSQVSKTL